MNNTDNTHRRGWLAPRQRPVLEAWRMRHWYDSRPLLWRNVDLRQFGLRDPARAAHERRTHYRALVGRF
jgi:hypothetical protein